MIKAKPQIATVVRKVMEERAERMIWPDDLEGQCAIASMVLRDALRAYHHDADLVMGEYGTDQHCWVESGTYIFDVTASQFNRKPVVIVKRDKARLYHNKVIVTEKNFDEAFLCWFDQTPRQSVVKPLVKKVMRRLHGRA